MRHNRLSTSQYRNRRSNDATLYRQNSFCHGTRSIIPPPLCRCSVRSTGDMQLRSSSAFCKTIAGGRAIQYFAHPLTANNHTINGQLTSLIGPGTKSTAPLAIAGWDVSQAYSLAKSNGWRACLWLCHVNSQLQSLTSRLLQHDDPDCICGGFQRVILTVNTFPIFHSGCGYVRYAPSELLFNAAHHLRAERVYIVCQPAQRPEQ